MGFTYFAETDKYVGSHNFEVEIVGLEGVNADWVTVSGVVSESEEVEFSHGVDPYVRKTGGRVTYEPIVMERVYRGTDALYQWRLRIEDGVIERMQIIVKLLNTKAEVVRSMTLQGAWPIKWEMPDFDANASGPALEKITFSVERVRET